MLANLNRQGNVTDSYLGENFLGTRHSPVLPNDSEVLAEELFSSRHGFLSECVSVHACVYRKQDELLWVDFLARSPAPFAQSLYMFPQDYTTHWSFQLGCNIWHVDG